MASPNEGIPAIPAIGLELPPSTLTPRALAYAKKHCTETVYNHAVRSAYWAVLIASKLAHFKQNPQLNLEAVVISCILHDMGWATTPELLSKDKRFEVDSANIARDLIKAEQSRENTEYLDEATIQRIWDAIALHTTGSIARYGAPEVALTNLGVSADFMGPHLPGPDGTPLITPQEYAAVMRVFPRAGFNKEGFKDIMCALCRTKPETTYDNFVGEFGRIFGTDGVGGGRDEYAQAWKTAQKVQRLLSGLDALEALDSES
ncbi:metal dependent phosphohydrolase [Penicillium sp. IBT 31633x]|nr:metal dependent phosphohydrolase [Penicillium sp. IBT 31633x]